MKPCRVAIIIFLLAVAGCGTSKWTDTGRSATEQLLITDAMDRAVSDLDFRALAGKTCFIDATPLKKISDSEYLVSCMRQHMFSCGCIVKDSKADADYVVEVRAGAVGTDRHDVLYGVPAVNVPTVVPVAGLPSQIPEMPFVKKTDQRAVVKLSLFAYHQKTGRPIWQSGAVPEESKAKAVWVLGAGPFQRGTIYDGMEFAGDKLDMPLVDIYRPSSEESHVSVADEAFFADPSKNVEPEAKTETTVAASNDKSKTQPKPTTGKKEKQPNDVVPAGHAIPASKAAAPSSSPAPPTEQTSKPTGDGPEAKGNVPETTTQVAPSYPANDLAPSLKAVSPQEEPLRLRIPVLPNDPVAIPQPLDESFPAIPRLVIPE